MTAVVAPPRSPFKGLSAFEDTDLDALLFFGRERERDVIVANMLASRLTVLYGESGVGKSSILRAAVARELRRVAPAALVEVHDTWSADDPTALLAAAGDAVESFLILDQFEEFFLYHGSGDGDGSFVRSLGDLLHETGRVHVLVSLREDALAQLDAFDVAIPGMFANRLRLEQLDREAARSAILGPVARWNELTGDHVDVEPGLVEAVLDEVTAGRVELGPAGVGAGGTRGAESRVEAPYLQLVLERLWEAERSEASPVLRRDTLRELGGAEAIVRDHLERALDRLEPDERRVAASVFDHLVTPSGTKIAHRLGDLAQYASVSEDALTRTLGALTRERIVRSVDGGKGSAKRYEIFHDVLAQPVRAWQSRLELERERAAAARRQRRLVRVTGAALVALAIVAGLAIFAFTQRSSARSEAHHAHALELEATAVQQLGIDPERSLMLALDAARLEPGTPAEDVLRQALLAARLRLVLSARGPVRAVAYSPDGRWIATGSTDGRVRIYDATDGGLLHVVREWGRLVSVAFAPDGSRVLAAGENGVATIWEVRTARLVAQLRHGDAVTSATFSRDGTRVLTSSADGTARVWDAGSGRLLRVLRNPGPVALARFSPDGALVATVAADPQEHVLARVYSASTGRLLHRFPQRGIDDVAFSPDGKLLATASQDGTTRLFDPGTGRLVRALDDGGGGVVAIAFSPDGKLLATGGDDSAVRIWTVSTGARLLFFVGHTNPLTAIAWSPDGRLVASASGDRTTRLWAVQRLVEAGSLVAVLAGHQEQVSALAFSPDGRRLVTGGSDWTARVWDVRPEQVLVALGRHDGGVARARYGADGRLVVSAGLDGVAKLWDTRTRRLVRTFGSGGAPLEDVELSPGGATLATAGGDGEVRVWNVRTGALLQTLPHGGLVHVAAFSPDGRWLVSAGSRAARLWNPRSGALLATMSPRSAVVDAAWSPDSERFVTATSLGVAEWSTATGRLLHAARVPGGATHVAFSPRGDRFAAGAGDGDVRLYAAADGRLEHVLRGHTLVVTSVVFGSDGRTLFTSSMDRDARSWDVATGTVLRVFRGHFGTVADVAVSGDGRWVATAGPISAGLWPSGSGQLLFYLRGHTGLLRSVAFSPDGRHLLTASMDGTLRTYSCEVCGNLDELITLAQKRLGRTARALTPAQRARYLQR